jgi:hypothetical protein
MVFSFLYLAFRAVLGALVRSRRSLDVKDVELGPHDLSVQNLALVPQQRPSHASHAGYEQARPTEPEQRGLGRRRQFAGKRRRDGIDSLHEPYGQDPQVVRGREEEVLDASPAPGKA